jgi:hypothetical protein
MQPAPNHTDGFSHQGLLITTKATHFGAAGRGDEMGGEMSGGSARKAAFPDVVRPPEAKRAVNRPLLRLAKGGGLGTRW